MEKVLEHVKSLYDCSSLSPEAYEGMGYLDLEAYPPEKFLAESEEIFAQLSNLVKKNVRLVEQRALVLEYCYFFLCFSVKSGLMARIDDYNDLAVRREIDQNEYNPNNYAFFRHYVTALEKGFVFKTKKDPWLKRDIPVGVELFEACGNLLPLVKFGGEGYFDCISDVCHKYKALLHLRYIINYGTPSNLSLPPLEEGVDEYTPAEMVSVNSLPRALTGEAMKTTVALSDLENNLIFGFDLPWEGSLPLAHCQLGSMQWAEVILPYQTRRAVLFSLWKNAENSQEKDLYLQEYLAIAEKCYLIYQYEKAGTFPSHVVTDNLAEKEKQSLAGVSIKDVSSPWGVVRGGQLVYRKMVESGVFLRAHGSYLKFNFITTVEIKPKKEVLDDLLALEDRLKQAQEDCVSREKDLDALVKKISS